MTLKIDCESHSVRIVIKGRRYVSRKSCKSFRHASQSLPNYRELSKIKSSFIFQFVDNIFSVKKIRLK